MARPIRAKDRSSKSEIEQVPDARPQGRYRRRGIRSVASAEPQQFQCALLREKRGQLVGDRRAIPHQRSQALLCDLINDHEGKCLDAAECTLSRQKTAFTEAVTRCKTPHFRLTCA